jgi:hypothetical protein
MPKFTKENDIDYVTNSINILQKKIHESSQRESYVKVEINSCKELMKIKEEAIKHFSFQYKLYKSARCLEVYVSFDTLEP